MREEGIMNRWTEGSVPGQQGRTVVITGGNTGLGFEAARVLAQAGAAIVLACRDPARGAAAAARIRVTAPGARVDLVHLDLASLASVREAADQLRASYPVIDLLINNAGGVNPRYQRTEDGFERTLATNHLGPFALTGLVLDRLLPVPGSRVVTVSSIGHRRGVINFDDLQAEQGYRFQPAYFQSKLANLLFTCELQARLAAAGAATIAVAAHPGNARTEFGRDMSRAARIAMSPRLSALTWWLMQSPRVGALATVRAATDPDTRGGDYYGPPGRAQFTGYPVRVESSARSHDTAVARRLWQESERLTGVTYPIGAVQPSGG
ncbi:MAG: family NAD(P)-dependent oxidoreductase [Actinomycetia bacterium]|nr:family NAD(P)-dependent oxidoreductase [Actinomycetes bacterium]